MRSWPPSAWAIVLVLFGLLVVQMMCVDHQQGLGVELNQTQKELGECSAELERVNQDPTVVDQWMAENMPDHE